MASASMNREEPRDRLAHLILDAIGAWPERDRRIFVSARYRGLSLERIAREHGMLPGEVRLVLEECERRLYGALRRFRRDDETAAAAAGRGGRAHCLLSRTPALTVRLASPARTNRNQSKSSSLG